MRARRWQAGVAVAAASALALPVVLAALYARHDARSRVLTRAGIYADEVLHRSDVTTDQIEFAIDHLRALPGDPCGPAHIALMRQLDVSSSYIQAIGHTVGDKLSCSSLSEQRPVDLGPAEQRSVTGALVRTEVQLAPGDATSFLVVEQHGYAVIVHKQLPLDVANDTSTLSVATVLLPAGTLVTSRGDVRPEWGKRGHEHRKVAFVSGSRAVVVSGSARWHIAAVSAFAPSVLSAEVRSSLLRFVPVGVVLGSVLAALVVLLGRRRLTLAAEVRAAVRRDELYLEYQPVVRLQSGELVGVEALLRWRRPDGRLVRPDLFVPAAEEAGLMGQVTRRVLQLVRADWPALVEGRPGLHVAINISPQDVEDADLVEELCQMRGLPGGHLIVEITERGMLDHKKAARVFARLRSCGLEVAVDDFGTGYSSLSYLETFPLDYLKIDKSFVDSLGAEAATSNVAVHIIDMARALTLRIVAEGVETEEQAAFLRDRGVQLAQGWLFGRPGRVQDLDGLAFVAGGLSPKAGPGVSSGHEGAVQHS